MSQANTDAAGGASELIYPIDANPPFIVTSLGALQHILAMILGVMAPPAIVASALGAPAEVTAYLISMSLFFAGASIFVQVSRPFGIGSGMLNVQATSFAFPGTLCSVGIAFMQGQGMGWEETLATLLGVCFVGSFWLILGAYAIHYLRKVITHTVAGVTVLMIGTSLIKVAALEVGGGHIAQEAGNFGDATNLLLGALVIFSVVLVNRFKNPLLRMCSLVIGMSVGFFTAVAMGRVDWSILDAERSLIVLPVPFKFGFFGFDLQAFIVISFIFLVAIIESIGDITATASVSEQPTRGPVYRARLKGGILCGGVFSAIGAIFGCFPQVTFAQNNGVIQLSGVASRKVGRYCGVLFIIFACFPVVVTIFELLPRPVLGGALVVLFGTIATSGIRILAEHGVNRRESIVIATALGVGFVSMMLPELFHKMPQFVQIFFDSPVVSGGVTAMIAHQILPKGASCLDVEDEEDPECEPLQEFFIPTEDNADLP